MTRAKVAFVIASGMTACIVPNERAAGDPSTSSHVVKTVFSAQSPFNLPVPAHPLLDPNSVAMVTHLARTNAANAGLFEFGIPIFDAGPDTPRRVVACGMSPAWGTCPFSEPVPIPDDARPHTGSDGALVVVDWITKSSYEFWQFRRQGQGVVTSWGALHSLGQSGWGGVGSSTASGASRLGGVVRVAEIEAGRIAHALVMSIDNACEQEFRPPATKTDGESKRRDCTPQGARLQLDPSIDLGRIAGIGRGELTIGRALQEFGVYVIDKGGAPMALSFELARDATSANQPGSTYVANGLSWDYFALEKIPWSKLRVLRDWTGK